MAREYAQLRPAMWSDDDYTDLSFQAQWLYEYLLTSPTLTFAGVADWRPNRIAQKGKNLTPEIVEAMARELEAGQYVLVDRTTEEVLIRSFAKWDGLLKQPKMAVAFATAATAIESKVLRQVLVGQLVRLQKSVPDLKAWDVPKVQELLERRSLSFEEGFAILSGTGTPDPSVYPSVYPSGSPTGSPNPEGSGSASAYPPPSPAPTPAPLHQAPQTSSKSAVVAADAAPTTTPRKPTTKGTRLPEPFDPTPEMARWAMAEVPGIDHRRAHAAFVDYWRAQPGQRGVKLDWVATWRNWMREEFKRARPAGVAGAAPAGSGWGKGVPVDPYGLGEGA